MNRCDPLLIKIPLSPSQLKLALRWADRHNEAEGPCMNHAWIESDVLHVNAYDLTDLIRISNTADASEFDVRRLKADAIRTIRETLARRRSPLMIRNLRNAGTVMHRSHLPLQEWFWAAYLVATHTPGISAHQLQRQLGISSDTTAWHLLHRLRKAMVKRHPNSAQRAYRSRRDVHRRTRKRQARTRSWE